MEKVCDMCHITLNKNAVVGDVSAMTPGGCRIGTPAMTSRGLTEKVKPLTRLELRSLAPVRSHWQPFSIMLWTYTPAMPRHHLQICFLVLAGL